MYFLGISEIHEANLNNQNTTSKTTYEGLFYKHFKLPQRVTEELLKNQSIYLREIEIIASSRMLLLLLPFSYRKGHI